MNEKEIAAQLAAEGKNGRRVTHADIDALIEQSVVSYSCPVPNKLMVCAITVPSGFVVVGWSACIDPMSFSETIGRQVSLERATSQLWELEAYRRTSIDHLQREMAKSAEAAADAREG